MDKLEIIQKHLNAIKACKGNEKLKYINELYNNIDIIDWDILFPILEFQYDSRITSGIALKSLNKKIKKDVTYEIKDIFDCLEYIKNNGATDEVIYNIQTYIKTLDAQYVKTVMDIVTQNIKIGVTANSINKAIDEKITQVKHSKIFIWKIQGGKPMDNLKLKKNEEFALQQKLNGVRATYHMGNLMTRGGKKHFGLDTIINEIEATFGKNYVVDGELIRMNKDNISDNENFRKTLSIVNSKEQIPEKEDILLVIYDIVPLSQFENETFLMPYISERMDFIQSYKNKIQGTHIGILPVLYVGNDTTVIQPLLEKYDKMGFEGLMLYRDTLYKKSKHNGLIKIKTFKFSDLIITGYYLGDDSGKWKDKFGGFVVDYKGNRVNVGGGYSDEQREYFLEHANDYIGKIAEIKYKEESQNSKTGLYSIQFPVFVRIRDDKTEPSYE